MSAVLWLCGPSAIGKGTLADTLCAGDPASLEAFGLALPPVPMSGLTPSGARRAIGAPLHDPTATVLAKYQYHHAPIARAAAVLCGDRLHRVAVLWCAPEIYAARYAAKYPGLPPKTPADLAEHWAATTWPHAMELHTMLVALGAACSVEVYDVSASAPLRVYPACALRLCDCEHADPAALVSALSALSRG